MAESITFDFISRNADKLAGDFKKTGDSAAAAARGAKVLQDTIDSLGTKENRTAAESARLAQALRLTGDAEDKAAAKALAADIAIRKLADAEAAASKKSGDTRAGFAGLASEITGFGSAVDAANSKGNKFKLALAGLNLASGVLEPALAGVVVAAGGIAAAYSSAAIGLGVFGVVAGTVFNEASQAATKYAAAVQKYDAATTSKQRAAALQQEKAAFAGLSAPVKTLAQEIGNVKQEWQGFTNAAAPGVVGVISKAFGLLPQAFALMKPFLAPVEQALGAVIGELKAGTGPTSEFAKIMRDFAAASGTDLKLALDTAGHVLLGLLGVVHAFLPEGTSLLTWVEQASVKFQQWGTTLGSHSGFQSLMQTFKTETPQAVEILKNLAVVVTNVGKAMFGLSTFSNSKTLLQALLPLSGVLASLSKNTDLDRIVLYLIAATSAANKLAPAFAGIKAAVAFFPGAWAAIVKFSGAVEGAAAKEVIAAAATKVWAGAQAVLNAVMDANPIVLVVAAAAALAAGFYLAWEKSALFRDIIKDIGKAMLTVGIAIVQADKIIVDSFLSMVGTVLHGAATAFGWVPGLGGLLKTASAHFDEFKGGVDNAFNSMITTMKGWQGELNASKTTSAQASAAIVADMVKAGGSATTAKNDIAAYTTAIQQNESQSAQRAARAKLIADLEAAGVNANTAKTDVNNLQTAISKLSGKTITIKAIAAGSGGVSVTASGLAAKEIAISSKMAHGGLVRMGSGPVADDVPAMLSRGELVVPAAMVKGGVVDHLRGVLPGFAGGGLAGGVAAFPGALSGAYGGDNRDIVASDLTKEIQAMIAAMKAAQAAQAGAVSASGARTGSVAVEQAYAFSLFPRYGWGASQKAPLIALWNQESGWNPYAVNPNGGAYGIPQSLGHGHPYNLGDYQAQIQWGENYIKNTYGSPSVAWGGYWARGGWYGNGLDAVISKPTLIGVGERGPERVTVRPEPVIPAGRSGTGSGTDSITNELRGLRAELRQLTGVAAAIPARTGQHVAGAVGGATAAASFRARYPAGGR